METINDRVKILRKYLELTLEQFGTRLGVTRAAMSNIENNNRNVTEQMIKSICREFKISEAWLRDGVGDMKGDLSKNDEIAICVQDMLDDTDNIVADAIKEFIVMYYMKMDETSKQALKNIGYELLEALKNRGNTK